MVAPAIGSYMPDHNDLRDANRRIVEALYAALLRGDVDGLFALLSDDIEWTTPASLGDMGGYHRGMSDVRAFFDYVGQRMTLDEFHVDRYVADGDAVVAVGSERVTILATAKPYDARWAHVFTLEGGKVRSFVEYVDPTAALSAMGRG